MRGDYTETRSAREQALGGPAEDGPFSVGGERERAHVRHRLLDGDPGVGRIAAEGMRSTKKRRMARARRSGRRCTCASTSTPSWLPPTGWRC
jgi:hypothetical protein